MWELIRANKRRSVILVLAMLLLMLALGFLIGAALGAQTGGGESYYGAPDAYGEPGPGLRLDLAGGLLGMAVATLIWGVQASVAYFQGDRILLRISGARSIEKSDHPQLFNVVEEMTIAARLPKMPAVYIIDSRALNAFATGRKPEDASVAVTAGLLGSLNRDQLQGVVAHEISHIVNRDVLFMTMVGIMVGTVAMMSELFLRVLWHGGHGARFGSGNKKGGGGAIVLLLLAVVLAIIAPLLAQVIYFAISRRREYLADAGAAVYTRYPEGLASALEVLAGDTNELLTATKATAPMFIINPIHRDGAVALNITRTHPPIAERVRILRSLGGGVSYARYQTAWAQAGSAGKAKMPASVLGEDALPVRAPSGEVARKKSPLRETGDLMRMLNDFAFLTCACGLKLKVPPQYKQPTLQCPRCQRALTLPNATGVAPAAAAPPAQEPLVVEHGGGWVPVQCSCGAVKSLSPSFSGSESHCDKCGRKIIVAPKN